MSDRKTFVIAGGGLAGATAASTLRSEGFEGRVVLVAGESQLPYERPPLSKSYLAGEQPVRRRPRPRRVLLRGHRAAHRHHGHRAGPGRPRRPPVGRRRARLRPAADRDRRGAAAPADRRRRRRRRARPANRGRRRPAARDHRPRRPAGDRRSRVDRLRGRRHRPQRGRRGDADRAGRRPAASRARPADRRRSSPTCTAPTASSCSPAPPSPPSSAAAGRCASADGRTIDCDATLLAVGVAPVDRARRGGGPRDRRRRSSPTPTCARATRTSSWPATSPRPTTPATGATCAWSTGTRRRRRAPPRRTRCSAAASRTRGCRSSSPTSTTSGWSTSAGTTRPTSS